MGADTTKILTIVILLVTIFLALMWVFTIHGDNNRPIDVPNQSDVQTPGLNQFDQTNDNNTGMFILISKNAIIGIGIAGVLLCFYWFFKSISRRQY